MKKDKDKDISDIFDIFKILPLYNFKCYVTMYMYKKAQLSLTNPCDASEKFARFT